MMPNQGFGDFDRLRHRSPSPMASSNLMSNVGGTGLGGWNGLPQEVSVLLFSILDVNRLSVICVLLNFVFVTFDNSLTCLILPTISLQILFLASYEILYKLSE